MSMTITEKILAAHAGLDKVEPGQIIMANVDVALGNDITPPPSPSANSNGAARHSSTTLKNCSSSWTTSSPTRTSSQPHR